MSLAQEGKPLPTPWPGAQAGGSDTWVGTVTHSVPLF